MYWEAPVEKSIEKDKDHVRLSRFVGHGCDCDMVKEIRVIARYCSAITHTTHLAGSIPAQAVYSASLPMGMPIPFTPWSPSPAVLWC